MKEIKPIHIAHRYIGQNHPPFIIAEMSGNHNHSLNKALNIVEAAAKAGAHAIKLQTYTAETMTLNIKNNDFMISDPSSLWHGRYLYDLYDEAHTPWEWHYPIMERCRELGLICFSTPFDISAVNFLEDLGVPAYKIASFENTDIHLIKRVCETKKPIIISTGMTTLSDLALINTTLRDNGCENYILLKCTSAYPALPKEINLMTLPHMSTLFNCHVGLSDHTLGIGVAVASIALGARVIEKHFTCSRVEGGVDSAFSLEPHELDALVKETLVAWEALGEVSYERGDQESSSLKFKRSLYVCKDIKAGAQITAENMRAIRPGYGLEPRYYDEILGKHVKADVAAGTPISLDLLEL